MTIDDETLMAYVDGELDDAGAQRVREALARDPALARRMRVFEDSARLLRESFRGAIDVPVPEHLEQLVAPRPARQRMGWLAQLWRRVPSPAFAAALLLAVGVLVGYVATRVDRGGPAAPVDRVAALQAAEGWHQGFERTPSGESFTLRVHGLETGIRPLTTFLDARDRVCRAFREDGAGSMLRRGIVCREEEGRWAPMVVVAEPAPVQRGPGGGYRPASSLEGGAFEGVLQMYMTTSPFEPAQERALMENGWRYDP